jgi:hypothetical protein
VVVEATALPLRRFTLKVMGRTGIRKVDVRADGSGLSSRAGTALFPLVAERVGLTAALSWALPESASGARRMIRAGCSAIWR